MSYASPFQLALFEAERSPPASLQEAARVLAFALSRELKAPVRMAVTDNRSTMISFHRTPAGFRLRIHHMFLEAPPPVVEALVNYVAAGSEQAGAMLDDYIRGQQERIRSTRTAESPELKPVGRCVDLQAVFNRLNAHYFDGGIQAQIGWSRTPGKRRRKSIRLGVYDHQLREIRIHPALDNPIVPAFFVEFIVFHEMLHQLFPSTVRDMRRVHHPRAFRERERTFPRYREALEWERAHLGQLLRR